VTRQLVWLTGLFNAQRKLAASGRHSGSTTTPQPLCEIAAAFEFVINSVLTIRAE